MIQIDMEMPEKCGLCPLFHAEHPMYCQGVKADRKKKIVAPYRDPRPEWCPIPEIQPDPDTVSRKAVLDAVCEELDSIDHVPQWVFDRLTKKIANLPSAQPETHEERTETHACDLIDRQTAIDALDVGAELLRRVLDDANIVGAERAKYEWGLGLIESYISDMKELPSAQPDMSGYSDKLWRNAYERGRAEALAEIVRCKDCIFHGLCRISPKWAVAPKDDWYCADAERSTDERCD